MLISWTQVNPQECSECWLVEQHNLWQLRIQNMLHLLSGSVLQSRAGHFRELALRGWSVQLLWHERVKYKVTLILWPMLRLFVFDINQSNIFLFSVCLFESIFGSKTLGWVLLMTDTSSSSLSPILLLLLYYNPTWRSSNFMANPHIFVYTC